MQPLTVDERDHQRCITCGHVCGWHLKSFGQCEHRPGIGEQRDCQCRVAIVQSEHDMIVELIAENRTLKYMAYMTGMPRGPIELYIKERLRQHFNGERWVPYR